MDAVEEIKNRLAIEDVIGEYVLLKRAGRNFKGLSPFTAEKTPSFMVSPEKQIWHDFSSGKGGNLFSFVMEMEGVDFKGALELLARRAGIDLSQYQTSGSELTKQRERLFKLVEQGAKFYQVQLKSSQTALNYVIKKRAFTKESILNFKLGYSPNTGNALINYLTKKGFSIREIQQAGLATKSYQKPVDMFRGRLMIPLSDASGRVIGFTARSLNNEESPKYINTPQSLLYDKSRNVYGFDLAKQAIRQSGFVIICEGNLDVITSHQAGIKQAVASAGTAMTKEQLKQLSNLTKDVRLAFDQDQAGQTATERAIPIASQVGVNLSVIVIPGQKDPDDLIKEDPKIWAKVIGESIYALDWLIEAYKNQINLDTVLGKRKFTDIVLPVVAKLDDPVERDHYLNQIGKMTETSKDALISKLESIDSKAKPVLRRHKPLEQKLDKEEIEKVKSQDQLLALAISVPFTRVHLHKVSADMLANPDAKKVLIELKKASTTKSTPLNIRGDYAKMLSLLFEALYQDLDETELDDEAKLLQDRLIVKYVKQQKNILSKELLSASETDTQKLLKQAKELDDLLRYTKEVNSG